jgi:galactokinase
MSLQKRVTEGFKARFGLPPRHLVRAPGRVNLIGEHTDYNDGFVLPMAIDRGIWIALGPTDDRQVQLFSLDFGNETRFPLDGIQKEESQWGDYVRGTAWALREANIDLTGWRGVMAGDIPMGAGLSSSAALEMAVVQAFCAAGDVSLSPQAMAEVGQRCENRWIGVNSGIMDQMVSAAGEAGHALLIDCRSLETRPVPLPQKTVVAILDTGVQRGLVDSAYNQRRRQCEAAARHFKVASLRDVSTEQFYAESADLPDTVHRRALHVISENRRTLDAADAMAIGDVARIGRLMRQSHASLREDFEVSCPELDAMVVCAESAPGCLGARMTGAGFGGCAVALVKRDHIDAFTRNIVVCYKQATDRQPAVYISQAEAGTTIIF